MATLYIIAFWPIIQIADILSPALELPDAVMRYLIIAFVAGFPLALILAWLFDVNRDGIEVTGEEDSAKPLVGNRTEVTIIGVLAVIVVALFLIQVTMDEEPLQETTPAITSTQNSLEERRSIGVLPFVSFDTSGTSSEEQQFADGLTEELLNVLSRVQALRVAARTSTFAYRGVNKNVTEIGKELNVAYILEGSVRRNDVNDTIRVTAQLIETGTGGHLWSKTYDREFTDIFQIQDDIAASVVRELEITLLADDQDRIKSRASAKPEAMVAFGMGQDELARRTEVSMSDAIRFFQRAINEDPNYTDAHVALANAYTLMASYRYAESTAQLTLAQSAVDAAFAIEPNSGAAHAAQGLIYTEQGQYAEAKRSFKTAMDLSPSYAPAYMWYANLQADLKDQLVWYQKAYELDPRSPVIGYNVANCMLLLGQYAEAMAVFAEIIEADPGYPGAYELVARINERRGRLDEAISQYRQAFELQPRNQYAIPIAGLYIDLGDIDTAKQWIEIAGDNKVAGDEIPIEWLNIQLLASQSKIEEAGPLLQSKVDRMQAPDLHPAYFLDGAHAAYFLDEHAEVTRAYEALTAAGITSEQMHQNGQYIEVALAAAHAYAALGNTEQANATLDHVETLLGDNLAQTHYSPEDW